MHSSTGSPQQKLLKIYHSHSQPSFGITNDKFRVQIRNSYPVDDKRCECFFIPKVMRNAGYFVIDVTVML